MVDLKYIKTKLEKGVYLTLKEKREYIKWCINYNIDNERIINDFKKYDLNIPQFEFMLNSMRTEI